MNEIVSNIVFGCVAFTILFPLALTLSIIALNLDTVLFEILSKLGDKINK